MEHEGEILLLHRHKSKSEGGRWGVPAGKREEGEEKAVAMLREIKEETGQDLTAEKLEYLTKVYVKYPEYHFVYYMFRAALPKRLKIKISKNEHTDYRWVSPHEAMTLNLVRELDRCISMFYPVS
jgi:8-oxo-dGTP pyrophosphatase MutT (NUDIX family)